VLSGITAVDAILRGLDWGYNACECGVILLGLYLGLETILVGIVVAMPNFERRKKWFVKNGRYSVRA
jgi:ABC-type antimicrobial peptide transport system permease subunit